MNSFTRTARSRKLSIFYSCEKFIRYSILTATEISQKNINSILLLFWRVTFNDHGDDTSGSHQAAKQYRI